MSQTWEYSIVRFRNVEAMGSESAIQDDLNGLGSEGWEVVSVVLVPRTGMPAEVLAFLKRAGKIAAYQGFLLSSSPIAAYLSVFCRIPRFAHTNTDVVVFSPGTAHGIIVVS